VETRQDCQLFDVALGHVNREEADAIGAYLHSTRRNKCASLGGDTVMHGKGGAQAIGRCVRLVARESIRSFGQQPCHRDL
jgi:hypothetical protein